MYKATRCHRPVVPPPHFSSPTKARFDEVPWVHYEWQRDASHKAALRHALRSSSENVIDFPFQGVLTGTACGEASLDGGLAWTPHTLVSTANMLFFSVFFVQVCLILAPCTPSSPWSSSRSPAAGTVGATRTKATIITSLFYLILCLFFLYSRGGQREAPSMQVRLWLKRILIGRCSSCSHRYHCLTPRPAPVFSSASALCSMQPKTVDELQQLDIQKGIEALLRQGKYAVLLFRPD